METYKGKNGILVGDNGDTWRAFSPSANNVQDPQQYEYKGHSGKPTGIYYYMGFDPSADAGKGGTRIAFCDYPKDRYTLEEIVDGEDTPFILMNCNVCHAMDNAAKRTGRLPYAPSVPAPQAQEQIAPSYPAPALQERLSVGPVVAATLPKWLPKGIQIAKALSLKPVGDATVTLGLSFLADFASGLFPDPSTRQALQSFSDDMIDSLDPDIVKHIQDQALDIGEAALKDGDAVISRKMFKNMMFKTRGDLKKEVEDEKKKRDQQQNNSRASSLYPSSSPSPVFNIPENSGRLGIPRLFE